MDILEEYRQAAMRQSSAKTASEANSEAEKLLSIYRELRNQGEEGIRALLSLLESPSESVRCWAATHLLPFASERAVMVLEALAAGTPGAARANASMTLREWRAGRLDLS